MNNTNPFYQELAALRHGKQIEAEMQQIRLQNEAARAVQQGWMAHRIAHLAEWMITTGESLRQRYDHASMHKYKPRTGALAQ